MRARIYSILLLVLLLSSCRSADRFEAGEEYSGEELREMRENLSETVKNDNMNSEGPGFYYFTESGSVYHADAECSSLANSKKVLSGGLSDIEARRLTPCARCME